MLDRRENGTVPLTPANNSIGKEKQMMSSLSRSRLVLTATLLIATCTGCPQKPAEKPADRKPSGSGTAAKPREQPAPQPQAKPKPQPAAEEPAESPQKPQNAILVAKAKPVEIPAPPTIPKVALSKELLATCLVRVGDELPEGSLPDLAGNPEELRSLFGQKLTVVCFWNVGTTARSKLVATAMLQDLTREVVEPYGSKGVQAIAINVGDSAQAVKQHVAQAAAKFPNLLDAQGEFFGKVAKDGRLPRTFLLDANGKVLWFDIEYSRPSRRDMLLGIRAALGEF